MLITLRQMSLGGLPAFTVAGTMEQVLSSLVVSNHSGKLEGSLLRRLESFKFEKIMDFKS